MATRLAVASSLPASSQGALAVLGGDGDREDHQRDDPEERRAALERTRQAVRRGELVQGRPAAAGAWTPYRGGLRRGDRDRRGQRAEPDDDAGGQRHAGAAELQPLTAECAQHRRLLPSSS
jgi:hypothetical protein